MISFIKKLLNMIGIDIVRYRLPYEEVLGYELEDETEKCIEVVKNNTMLSKKGLVTLYQQAVYCENHNVLGSFVECGVWKGGAMGVMALANLDIGSSRRNLHLFDAFQEICEPDSAVDGKKAVEEAEKYTGKADQTSGKLKPLKGFYDFLGGPGTLNENVKFMEDVVRYPSKYTHYHEGWFQETLPAVHESVGPIAILRLDGDWYASTKVCLEYLYDKVVSGGFVIIDDYGAYEGCRKAVDEFISQNRLCVFLSTVDDNCRYFIKP